MKTALRITPTQRYDKNANANLFERAGEIKEIVVKRDVLCATCAVDGANEDVRYPDKYQQFVNLWLGFCMDSFGKATVTVSRLIDDLGWTSGNSKTVAKAKKILDDTVCSEKQKYWAVATRDVITHKVALNIHDAILIDMKTSKIKWEDGDVGVFIGADLFEKIIKVSKANHVCSADLLNYYLFFLSSMITVKEKNTGTLLHGALVYTETVTNKFDISLKTHYKYREILKDAGILYYFKGMNNVPAGYALKNSPDIYDALIKRFNAYHAAEGRNQYLISTKRRETAVLNAFGKGNADGLTKAEEAHLKEMDDAVSGMMGGI